MKAFRLTKEIGQKYVGKCFDFYGQRVCFYDIDDIKIKESLDDYRIISIEKGVVTHNGRFGDWVIIDKNGLIDIRNDHVFMRRYCI